MAIVYIGLGSNLENPQKQVEQALKSLSDSPKIRVTRCSPWYQSHAIGPGTQADYINGVAELSTGLPPDELLDTLQSIENKQGRKRIERWGPRTLDLDILLYDQLMINSSHLQVPHPRMRERNFVLYPLADIAPLLVFPGGLSLAALIETMDTEGLRKVES